MQPNEQEARRLDALADAAAERAASLSVLWQCGALPDDTEIRHHEAMARVLRELARSAEHVQR